MSATLVIVPGIGGSGPTHWQSIWARETPGAPVPSMVMASDDDPCSSVAHAEEAARRWGSRFVTAGARGHLDARSGLGAWPEGRAILAALVAET